LIELPESSLWALAELVLSLLDRVGALEAKVAYLSGFRFLAARPGGHSHSSLAFWNEPMKEVP